MADKPALIGARAPVIAPRLLAAALSLAAGLGVALAFPPFGVLPGLLGFALLMHLCGKTAGLRPLRGAFWRGWLAVFCWGERE